MKASEIDEEQSKIKPSPVLVNPASDDTIIQVEATRGEPPAGLGLDDPATEKPGDGRDDRMCFGVSKCCIFKMYHGNAEGSQMGKIVFQLCFHPSQIKITQ